MDVKEPQTIDEQIKTLIDKHKCVIPSIDEARRILESINYYRLSSYFLTFREEGKEEYKPGTSITDAYRLYQFDQRFRKTIEFAIESIETMIKTKIAYFHSLEYGSLGYLNSNNYNSKFNSKEFSEEYTKYITRNQKTLVVQHHNEKYEGKFPFWVIIEFYDFGFMSKTFAQMPTKIRKAIASSIGSNSTCLESWLYCLTNLRNICAHGSRLYNKTMTAMPSTPKNSDRNLNKTVFSYILIIKELIKNMPEWVVFKNKLISLTNEYDDVLDLTKMGFPHNWLVLLNK